METIEISGINGLMGLGCLTANFLVGIFIWSKSAIKLPYNFTFLELHKFTGYSAAISILLHILLITLDPASGFTWGDLLLPLWTEHQPFANAFGALSFYMIAVVVITSYYKEKIKYPLWRTIHFTSYFAAIPLFIHSIVIDPKLKDRLIDWIDAEKMFVKFYALAVLALIVYRFFYSDTKSCQALKVWSVRHFCKIKGFQKLLITLSFWRGQGEVIKRSF